MFDLNGTYRFPEVMLTLPIIEKNRYSQEAEEFDNCFANKIKDLLSTFCHVGMIEATETDFRIENVREGAGP